MKVTHLRVDADADVTLPASLLAKIPGKVALFTTAQLLSKYEKLASQLKAAGKTVIRIKTPHTREPGQLLGCNLQPFKDYAEEEFDACLYIGDGQFHPLALRWKNDAPSFMYDPYAKEEYEASAEDVERAKKKYRAAISAFQIAEVIGVLIPHKAGGQTYLKWALELPRLYPDKTFINLVDYNVDFQGLEDFPFCDVFVNTACPRIPFDDALKLPRPVVNLEDVSASFYKKQLLAVGTPGKK
ncbi:diphthamide synthesis protein [Candidatus Woesearchaeota archaeon]|nr:diphthamide synthesis protein [Candidatus Woesearchaeota archaeon]